MKYKLLDKQIEYLRGEWKNATPERQNQIKKEADELKKTKERNFGCYECDECVLKVTLPFAFCSEECHEAWYKKSYAGIKKEKKSWSVEEMIQKLKEFAQDEHKKGNY